MEMKNFLEQTNNNNNFVITEGNVFVFNFFSPEKKNQTDTVSENQNRDAWNTHLESKEYHTSNFGFSFFFTEENAL